MFSRFIKGVCTMIQQILDAIKALAASQAALIAEIKKLEQDNAALQANAAQAADALAQLAKMKAEADAAAGVFEASGN
jgi:uncharacterized protein involved in exopolysaccharide biosynthesis